MNNLHDCIHVMRTESEAARICAIGYALTIARLMRENEQAARDHVNGLARVAALSADLASAARAALNDSPQALEIFEHAYREASAPVDTDPLYCDRCEQETPHTVAMQAAYSGGQPRPYRCAECTVCHTSFELEQ